MINQKSVIFFKVFFGLLGFSAIVTEIAVLLDRQSFNPVNFFSYFTILSNVFAVVTLLFGAYIVASKTKQRWFSDLLRGAATLYMVITGIVFSLLLANIENATLTAVAWDNTVLHYIMPIAVFIDWLIDRSRSKFSYKTSLLWLAFPIIYVVYSLVRGMAINWYPYPFLNPEVNGYTGVVVTVIGIALTSLVLSCVLIWTPRLLNNKLSK